MLWVEIEIERAREEITVSARGSRGERASPHALTRRFAVARIRSFAQTVGRAAAAGEPLSPRALSDAHALYDAVFSHDTRDILVRALEASGDAPLQLRFVIREPRLQVVPWEALCEPGTSAGFLATSPRLLTTRAITSTRPWQPREVRRGVRLLVIAPIGGYGGSHLRHVLDPAIQRGAVEWTEPITEEAARLPGLFEHLRRIRCPHVLHFVGHGGMSRERRPMLRLADADDGDETWIEVDAFAQELEASLSRELRLVFLEACSGARPGSLASAAEVFARRGADTVVAYMWPVRTEFTRPAASAFYRALTDGGQLKGDVAASMQATRRALLVQAGAAAFAPAVFVRGISSAPFDFEGRKLVPLSRAQSLSSTLAADVDPALEQLLDTSHGLVLDRGAAGEDLDGLQRFRSSLERALRAAGESEGETLALGTLTQRYALYAGQGRLNRMFQKSLALGESLSIPPIVDALGATLRPGVHVTLLWLPVLEHALLRHHADRTIYVVQTGYPNSGEKRVVLVRAPTDGGWDELEDVPEHLDLARDYVVLRLYGGYSPEENPILTTPRITEDDFIQGLMELGELLPPDWESQLMGWLRMHPALCLGISVLEWRHRMLLQWLFDYRAAPEGSVVLLGPEEREAELWRRQGASLPGRGKIRAVRCNLNHLANRIRAMSLSAAS